jgi:hypothetical protein
MNKQYDVVFHIEGKIVRAGPFDTLALAQDFVMSVDEQAFPYDAAEFTEHGEEITHVIRMRRPA